MKTYTRVVSFPKPVGGDLPQRCNEVVSANETRE